VCTLQRPRKFSNANYFRNLMSTGNFQRCLVLNIFSPGNLCQGALEATKTKLSSRRAINSRVVSDSRNENSICATSQETQQEKDKIVIIHSRSECTYVRALLHNQHYYIHPCSSSSFFSAHCKRVLLFLRLLAVPLFFSGESQFRVPQK
jgi:hypothetical protein